MTTNDDLTITEPETSESITRRMYGQVLPRPYTHRSAVFQGCVSLGHVWRLPDGQWTTWRDGPRFATAAEAAEELRALFWGASLSGPLNGAEVTR